MKSTNKLITWKCIKRWAIENIKQWATKMGGYKFKLKTNRLPMEWTK